MREYVVALHAGIDYDQFWTEIENTTSGLPHIPDRAVSIVNNRDAMDRLCHYALTDDEAAKLENDPRVVAVEIPIEQRPEVIIKLSATQTGTFTKPKYNQHSGDNINWGLIRHTNTTNIYGTANTAPSGTSYNYVKDGTNVDVVVADTGIEYYHPEFTDASGASRIIQYKWTNVTDNSIGSVNFRDDEGHGTHVASTIAGKIHGWAKNATIYPLKVGLAGTTGGINPTEVFDYIKTWHNSKPVNPSTGVKNPTVVNCSWGLVLPYSKFTLTHINWRGSGNIASSVRDPNKGMLTSIPADVAYLGGAPYPSDNFPYNDFDEIPAPVKYINVALDELIAAGVTVCIAANNTGYKIDVPGGQDYDNYFVTVPVSGQSIAHYHRGSSPISANAIMVGALGYQPYSSTLDKKAPFSATGPGVTIYAAGEGIRAAWITNDPGNSAAYLSTSFRQGTEQGTSMAAPQIAGMVALYLQTLPTATPAQVKSWLLDNATATMYAGTGSDAYTNLTSLQGGNALVAYGNFGVTSSPITYPVTATGNSPIIVSVVPTGRRQVLQVPPGVQSTCTMYLWGAGGAGGSGTVGGTGASGNAIKFTVSLQAGDQIDVSVGGKGFANGAPGYGHIEGADNYGGGTGGTASGTGTNGGGGGGATVVALSRAATTTQYAVTYVSDAYRESKSNTLTAWVEGINLSSATLSNTAITAMKSAVNYSTVSLYMDVMAVRTLSNVVNAFIDTVSGQINSYISSFPTDSSVYLCRGSTKIFGNNISFWDGTKQYTRTGTATPARFDATLTFTERASFISGMRATAGSTYSSASSAARSGMDAIFISVTDNILAPKLSAMACSVSLYNFTAITYVNRTTIAVAAGGAGGGGGESAGNSAKQGKNAGNSPSTNSNGYTGANGQSRASGSGGGGGGGGGGWYGGNGGAGSGGDTAGYAGESGASYNNPGYTTQATKYVGSQRVPQKINNFDVGEYATGGLANANGTDGYAVIVFTATTLPFVKDPALGWKQSTAAYVKAAGTWYPIVQVWTKVGTQWKQVAGGNSASLQFAQLPEGNGYGPGGTRNYGT